MTNVNLPTWTSALDVEALETALDLAEPGLSRSVWRERAHDNLSSPSERQRNKHIEAAGRLLDLHDADEVRATPFLSCFRATSGRERHDLVHGGYLATVPLARHAARELWRPGLREGRERIEQHEIDRFLAQSLRRCAESTFEKTRSTLLTEFRRLGVIHVEDDDRAVAYPKSYQPGREAFVWLLWREGDDRAGDEMTLDWAATESMPAVMFLCERPTAMQHLEWLAETPLVTRSQILGTPRIVFSKNAADAEVWDEAVE